MNQTFQCLCQTALEDPSGFSLEKCEASFYNFTRQCLVLIFPISVSCPGDRRVWNGQEFH